MQERARRRSASMASSTAAVAIRANEQGFPQWDDAAGEGELRAHDGHVLVASVTNRSASGHTVVPSFNSSGQPLR